MNSNIKNCLDYFIAISGDKPTIENRTKAYLFAHPEHKSLKETTLRKYIQNLFNSDEVIKYIRDHSVKPEDNPTLSALKDQLTKLEELEGQAESINDSLQIIQARTRVLIELGKVIKQNKPKERDFLDNHVISGVPVIIRWPWNIDTTANTEEQNASLAKTLSALRQGSIFIVRVDEQTQKKALFQMDLTYGDEPENVNMQLREDFLNGNFKILADRHEQ